jgi:hypothetical protein
MYGETVAVYCEDNTEYLSTLCEQNAVFSARSVGTYGNRAVLELSAKTFSVVVIIRFRNPC